MIYTIYNDIGEHIGGGESRQTDDDLLATELIAMTNLMVGPSRLLAEVKTGVRHFMAPDHYRYEIMYIGAGGHLLDRFWAVPSVIGHA